MKTIELLLIASAPSSPRRQDFTDAVLYKIQKSETFSSAVRKTSEIPTERKFFMSLRNLNKFTLALLIVLGLSVISGTAYAVYELWLRPEVNLNQTSLDDNGRNQLLFSTTNCTSPLSQGSEKEYETKRGTSLHSGDTETIVQAKCELAQIQTWVDSKWSQTSLSIDEVIDAYPVEVLGIEGDKFSLASTAGGRLSPIGTATASDKTLWVENGHYADKDSFKKGDSVLTVRHITYADEGGAPKERKLLALIKLSLPEKYYSPDYQNAISEKIPCFNNPDDVCAATNAGIDVFYNEKVSPHGDMVSHKIQGELLSYTDTSFTLRSSSGEEYTFNTTRDIIRTFNTDQGPIHKTSIEIGDSLNVDYIAVTSDNTRVFSAAQLQRVDLIIEVVNKNDALKKY